MKQFVKRFVLSPAVLSRSDITELASILADGQPELKTFDLSFSAGETWFRTHLLDEFLSHLPENIDSLSFSAYNWSDEGKTERSVKIELSRIQGSCFLIALDEVWFKGKIQQTKEFFERRRPWYGKYHTFIAFMFGVLTVSFVVALFFLLSKGLYLPSGGLVIVLGMLWKVFVAFLDGRLFPFTQFHLSAEIIGGMVRNYCWRSQC